MPPSPSTSRGGLRITRSRKVLLCVGPGGVGKTTVAAALALAAAQAGRKVIVVTIDPSRRLAQALGLGRDTSEGSPVVHVPGSDALGHPLDCLLLDTRRVFDQIVRGYSKSADAAQRMLENPIYLATVQHLGGALEYAAIARVHMLVSEGAHDLIVLDTPPTANAVEFLEAPARIDEILNNPAAKFLAASGRMSVKFLGLASNMMLKAFEAIGGGPFIGQLGRFLADFGIVLAEFQRRAGDVAALLTSKDTGVVIATAATDFSLREAKGLVETLRSRRMRIDGIVLNRVDPPIAPLPSPAVLRSTIASQVPASLLESTLAGIESTYSGARAQSERARRVQHDLERSYPELSVCTVERMHPPPIALDELLAMGRTLLG
jgi:anion-transporting  ArsA/GET3 family ATPase